MSWLYGRILQIPPKSTGGISMRRRLAQAESLRGCLLMRRRLTLLLLLYYCRRRGKKVGGRIGVGIVVVLPLSTPAVLHGAQVQETGDSGGPGARYYYYHRLPCCMWYKCKRPEELAPRSNSIASSRSRDFLTFQLLGLCSCLLLT